jgi:hypothetical protein
MAALPAIREVADRLDGKPRQESESPCVKQLLVNSVTTTWQPGRPEVKFQGREDRFDQVGKSAFAQTLKIAPRPPHRNRPSVNGK